MLPRWPARPPATLTPCIECHASIAKPPRTHQLATALVATLALLPLPSALAAAAPAPPHGTTLHDTARLADGDTLDLTSADGVTRRVRSWGVDAPEKKQACRGDDGADYPCGDAATDGLAIALGDLRDVTCSVKGGDQYGRAVASCAGPSGTDAGRTLVERGLAVELPQYSRGAYADAQARARAAHAGVWAGPFLQPAEWRREARIAQLEAVAARAEAAPKGAPRPRGGWLRSGSEAVAASAPTTPEPTCDKIKGNISSRGQRIYYVPADRLYASVKINRRGERCFDSVAEAEAAGWRAPAE